MGVTKTELFTEQQNRIAAIAKALGHPARVAIIEHLLKVKQCIGGEIVAVLPLSQPTISRHLQELKAVGLIKGNVTGVSVSYCIDAQGWRAIQMVLADLWAEELPQLDCDC